jgi:hypothetical protein
MNNMLSTDALNDLPPHAASSRTSSATKLRTARSVELIDFAPLCPELIYSAGANCSLLKGKPAFRARRGALVPRDKQRIGAARSTRARDPFNTITVGPAPSVSASAIAASATKTLCHLNWKYICVRPSRRRNKLTQPRRCGCSNDCSGWRAPHHHARAHVRITEAEVAESRAAHLCSQITSVPDDNSRANMQPAQMECQQASGSAHAKLVEWE